LVGHWAGILPLLVIGTFEVDVEDLLVGDEGRARLERCPWVVLGENKASKLKGRVLGCEWGTAIIRVIRCNHTIVRDEEGRRVRKAICHP
jgi:hypothetical protein